MREWEVWVCPVCDEIQPRRGVEAHCAGSRTEGRAHQDAEMIAATVMVARRGRGLGVGSPYWHTLYGTCGHCGRDVRRKRDGRLRSHGNAPHRGATRCGGSGSWPEQQR